jgi:hypothetical protein
MGKWRWRTSVHRLVDLDALCHDPYVCVCVDIFFDHIKLKDMFTWNPYLSAARCDIKGKVLLDNGKVISAESLRVALTDIDYNIVMDQYDFDWCAIVQVMECPKKPLPPWFLNAMKKWYADKTLLKGVEAIADKRRYIESKQRLNAIYGMECVQLHGRGMCTHMILTRRNGKCRSVKRIWKALKLHLKRLKTLLQKRFCRIPGGAGR